ncbi:hypothetical protein [Vineibacter terrae]|uniref:hypothetical protein n=1 Tax=Vineibacter terrae TaxID=2586908 RepID=UPI002E36F4C1|nr:hypothetical protein [Vineibacter terrae]HEX2889452.1 hypothetical protein [Vineibacter terrae]
MPQDLSPAELAERVRDRYADRHGGAEHLERSAAWDIASLTLALKQVQLAKSAVHDLARTSDLSITMALGADDSEEMISLEIAEDGLQRTLEALKRL